MVEFEFEFPTLQVLHRVPSIANDAFQWAKNTNDIRKQYF